MADASVAVCAHDAGAASHIAAWLAPYQKKISLCLEGPARILFANCLVSLPRYSLASSIENAHLLISGTGWSSDLEHNARVLARQRGIPSVAVLDHWVNYRSRFNFAGQEVLPDQLWVADSEAKALAQLEFPDLPVLQLPNQWITDLSQSVASLRLYPPKYPARRLIYFLEPIHAHWTGGPWNDEKCELQGLRFWLQKLSLLSEQGWIAPLANLDKLLLRPHPSEPSGKYDSFIQEARRNWPIHLDQSSTLADSLAWADMAFGCETQALVAALSCGLPAFSTIPPWAPSCRLPQSELQHLNLL